jgi:hypothetical protein
MTCHSPVRTQNATGIFFAHENAITSSASDAVYVRARRRRDVVALAALARRDQPLVPA